MEQIALNWEDPIKGGHTRAKLDATGFVAINVPWIIRFYCMDHQQVYASENGIISFAQDASKATNMNSAQPWAHAMRYESRGRMGGEGGKGRGGLREPN